MEEINQKNLKNIVQILPNYFLKYEENLYKTQKAVIFEINKKEGSKILKSLKDKLDIYADQYQVEFLKRFRGSKQNKDNIQFFFCLESHFEDLKEKTQFESVFKNELKIENFQVIKGIDVPVKKPINFEQFKKLNEIWPCKLIDEEKMYKYVFKGDKEKKFHIDMMNKCVQENKCFLVDPSQNNKIVVDIDIPDNKQDRVNMHSTMLIMEKLGNFIKNNNQEKEKIEKKVKINNEESKSNQQDQYYLATGLDFYIIDEPCIMCAMALIHSRIKRLILVNQHKIKDKGGIFNTQIFHMDSLNHKFAVFQIS